MSGLSMSESRISLVCGIDEAGRGPMAGPVCAAAVILPDDFDMAILNDSKKLTERKRETAMSEIYARAISWGIGWASAAEIDSINILQASLLAMSRAYEEMTMRLADRHPEWKIPAGISISAVIDGLYCPEIEAASCAAYPKADGTYPPVMAASILAKTARDRMMVRYGWLYPEYGYEKHKGYPTPDHIRALKENGPSPIQRTTFRLKHEGQLTLF
jgi:ribonuclease HII